MRENGSSVHLRTSQIPRALVLSDFTQRRLSGSPLSSISQVYFTDCDHFLTVHFFSMMLLFPIWIILDFLIPSGLLVLLPAPLALSAKFPVLLLQPQLFAFHLLHPSPRHPFFVCASCFVVSFIIRCKSTCRLSSLPLSSVFYLFPADMLPPNSLDKLLPLLSLDSYLQITEGEGQWQVKFMTWEEMWMQ